MSLTQIAYHPKMNWLAAATDQGVLIYNLDEDDDVSGQSTTMTTCLEISNNKSPNAMKSKLLSTKFNLTISFFVRRTRRHNLRMHKHRLESRWK